MILNERNLNFQFFHDSNTLVEKTEQKRQKSVWNLRVGFERKKNSVWSGRFWTREILHCFKTEYF